MVLEELYQSIVDDVFRNVREAFVDEGVDEQTMQALKSAWFSKLKTSAEQSQPPPALQPQPPHPHPQLQQQLIQPTPSNNSNNNISNNPKQEPVVQLDGSNGTSEEEDNDEELDEDYPDDSDEEDLETTPNRTEEDPLNSGDDISNDEGAEVFETDNVVVCQYDKITRNRNKWKFTLKDGVMNLNGRDYVFQRAVGDAEW